MTARSIPSPWWTQVFGLMYRLANRDVARIARDTGLSATSLHRTRRALNFPPRLHTGWSDGAAERGGLVRRTECPVADEAILAAWQTHRTLAGTAAAVHRNRITIRRRLERLGVQMSHRPGRPRHAHPGGLP